MTDIIYSRKQLIELLRDKDDVVSHQAALLLEKDDFNYWEMYNRYEGMKLRVKRLIEKYGNEC